MGRRLSLALALTMPAIAAAQAGEGFAGVPGAVVQSYDVAGHDGPAIRRAIDAARPTDPNDGSRVDALSRGRLSWHWQTDRRGGCDLAHARVTFTATVILPRLRDDGTVPAAVLADWQRYRAALERHEAGHVRYAYDHRGDVLAAIRGATCATANVAARAALARITAHDIAYDAQTRHGATQGATFPGL